MNTTSSTVDLKGRGVGEPAPLDPAAPLNHRGLHRFAQGDSTGALADFLAALQLNPDCATAWNNAGLVHLNLGRLRDALDCLDRAVALRPNYADALNNRGRARHILGDFAGAEADFAEALVWARGRLRATVLHNRAALRQAQGNLAGALADFDRALELDPEHGITYVNRGIARKEAGDLEGAMADCERALAMLPSQQHAMIYHGRGGIRALQNDFAGAVADYDRALALEPEIVCFYISRGNARYHLRDRRGLLDYRMAFRLDPDEATREVVRTLTVLNVFDALENCDKHLRLNDRDAVAYARRGLTRILMGRESEAEADFDRFRELAPDMSPYLSRVIEGLRGRFSVLAACATS